MRPCIPIMQKKSPPRPMPRRKRRAIPRPHIPRRSPSTILPKRVKKSEKLLKNTVKIGQETRTVVSGIAKFYTPEEMVGKKVIVVTNLKPAKLCGIVSEGMILCAEDAAGNLSLLSPEKEMESGSGIY